MNETETNTDLTAELLQGAWDVHMHAAPDVVPRIQQADEVLADARAAGMAAIGLKDHCGSTAALATVLDTISGETGPRVFGSITLNPPVGGLNPAAVEAALREGARTVWFPTYSAKRHLELMGRGPFPLAANETGLTLCGEGGNVRAGVADILSLIAEHDAVLSTGHLAPEESLILFRAAKEAGVKRMVLTHASLAVTDAPIEIQREALELGAWIEHCLLALTPGERSCSEAEMVGQMQAIGAERVFLTSDLGQTPNGPVVAGFGQGLARLIAAGLTREEAKLISSVNPERVLVG